MQQTRVKICGITSVADGFAAMKMAADAIGLVFYPPSPRAVNIENAKAIVAAVGPFVTIVALFVNPEKHWVENVLAEVKPHIFQFHGDESEDFCQQFKHPYLKAIRVAEETKIADEVAKFPSASGFIVDAWVKNLYGGTGKTFNWHTLRQYQEDTEQLQNVTTQGEQAYSQAMILAGGLTAENVAEAIVATKPYGVDVSGGVESSPGKKAIHKMKAFVAAAKSDKGLASL